MLLEAVKKSVSKVFRICNYLITSEAASERSGFVANNVTTSETLSSEKQNIDTWFYMTTTLCSPEILLSYNHFQAHDYEMLPHIVEPK